MYDRLGNNLKRFTFWTRETDYVNFFLKLQFYNIKKNDFFRWLMMSFIEEDEDLLKCLYKLTKNKKTALEKIYLTSYQSGLEKKKIETMKNKERNLLDFLNMDEEGNKKEGLFDIEEEVLKEIE